MSPKSLDVLKDLGGTDGLATSLRTDLRKGVSEKGEDLEERRESCVLETNYIVF